MHACITNLNTYQAWLVMIAVRDRIDKVERTSDEYWNFLNILRRFQDLRELDEPTTVELQLLKDTRTLLEPSTPTELLYGAWINKPEVEHVQEALFTYIYSNIVLGSQLSTEHKT
jgi:superfamily II RNA helicase